MLAIELSVLMQNVQFNIEFFVDLIMEKLLNDFFDSFDYFFFTRKKKRTLFHLDVWLNPLTQLSIIQIVASYSIWIEKIDRMKNLDNSSCKNPIEFTHSHHMKFLFNFQITLSKLNKNIIIFVFFCYSFFI